VAVAETVVISGQRRFHTFGRHRKLAQSAPGRMSEGICQVFEPFFATKPQGMGMGLPIARTIVEAHGGQLSVENEPGRGATFCIRLALAGQRT
jgi:C4-dicarboxylate-specific signal transduction histidine kinase